MWFRKTAYKGQVMAQNNLGVMYEQGRGVPQSDKEAAMWFLKAADQGIAAAQCNLGLMYSEGRGVPMNIAKALSWVRKAVAQGFSAALERVAELEAMQPSPAGLGPVECANCGALRGPDGGALKPCRRCKTVFYCGRECQKANGSSPTGHKKYCRCFG